MSIVWGRTKRSGRRPDFFTIGVCVALTLAWLTFGFVAGSVSSAKAADEPPPTTTAPEPQPSPDPAPVPTPKPTPKPKPKPKPKRHKSHVAVIPKTVQPKHVQSGVLGAESAAVVEPDRRFDYESLVIIATFAAAIACFGFTAIPVVRLPRSPAAHFVAERRVDAAVLGVGLLLGSGILLLFSHGT